MARPPVFPVEEKVRVELSILAGEVSVAEAARRAKVSEQSVANWKRQLLEAGPARLIAGKAGPSTREAQLEAEVADRTQALGEAAVELRCGRGARRAAWALRGRLPRCVGRSGRAQPPPHAVGASVMPSGAGVPDPATTQLEWSARFQFDLGPPRQESSDRRAPTLNEGSERIGRDLVEAADVHGLDLA